MTELGFFSSTSLNESATNRTWNSSDTIIKDVHQPTDWSLGVVGIFGCLINFVAAVITARNKTVCKSFRLLLLNILLVNFTIIVFYIILDTPGSMASSSKVYCFTNAVVYPACYFTMLGSVVGISAERLIAIALPLKHNVYVNLKITSCFLGSMWAFNFAFAAVSGFYLPSPFPMRVRCHSFLMYPPGAMVAFGVYVLFIIACNTAINVAIIKKLKSQMKVRAQLTNASTSAAGSNIGSGDMNSRLFATEASNLQHNNMSTDGRLSARNNQTPTTGQVTPNPNSDISNSRSTRTVIIRDPISGGGNGDSTAAVAAALPFQKRSSMRRRALARQQAFVEKLRKHGTLLALFISTYTFILNVPIGVWFAWTSRGTPEQRFQNLFTQSTEDFFYLCYIVVIIDPFIYVLAALKVHKRMKMSCQKYSTN